MQFTKTKKKNNNHNNTFSGQTFQKYFTIFYKPLDSPKYNRENVS